MDTNIPSKSGTQNVQIKEGIYNFAVVKVTRAELTNAEKLVDSPKALVDIEIFGDEMHYFTTISLILNHKLEFRLSGFFRTLRKKRVGEKYKMDWDHVEGLQGLGYFRTKNYIDEDGKENSCIELVEFITH